MKKLLLPVFVLLPAYLFAQDICHADGNVMIFSNYEGGHLTIDIDVDISGLKIGICTYEAAEVIFTGTYVTNITEVVYAGFDQVASGCGATVDETNFTGVDPSLVTKYSAITGDIAICNYLGDELFGSAIVNCMVGAEGCGETASGGGNASPQIVQFFLAEFGAGSALYSHWTDYSCFPTSTFYASEGGNCCFEDPVTPPNPIYDTGGLSYSFFAEDTVLFCDSSTMTLDVSFYPVVWGDPEWSNGDVGYSTTITEPGTYSVSIADYCHYDPFYLADTIVVLPCTSVIDTAICEGDNYSLPDGTIVTAAGSYETVLIAADGSDSIVTTNITVFPTYSASVSDFICSGDSYILPDGLLTISPGTYYSYLSTTDGCDSLIITTLSWAYPSFVAVADSFCTGGSYVLPDGAITDSTGVYVVTILSSAGCDSTITLTLNHSVTPEVFLDAAICAGDSYTLPDGFIVNSAGNYPVLITASGVCDTIFTTILTLNPLPVIALALPDAACIYDTIILSALPAGGTFSGTGVSGNIFDAEAAGAGGPYTIDYTYTDANGCTATAFDVISVYQNYIELGPDLYIRQGDSVLIDGFTYGTDISWEPNTALSCDSCADTYASPPQTTTYTAISVDDYGCVAIDSLTIFVDSDPDETIFIPNTFTPNGDGLNDYFFGFGPDVLSIRSMRIYDRWGDMVFEGTDIDKSEIEKGWDGNFKTMPVMDGVYAYLITFQLRYDKEIIKAGNVLLMR